VDRWQTDGYSLLSRSLEVALVAALTGCEHGQVGACYRRIGDDGSLTVFFLVCVALFLAPCLGQHGQGYLL